MIKYVHSFSGLKSQRFKKKKQLQKKFKEAPGEATTYGTQHKKTASLSRWVSRNKIWQTIWIQEGGIPDSILMYIS